MANTNELPPTLETKKKFVWPNLTVQVLLSLVLGVVLGMVLPDFAMSLKPMAGLFLKMIKMLIAPLLFSTLVVGIANGGDHKKIGRMGFKTLLYFEIATTLALLIGLIAGNVMQPGVGVDIGLGVGHASELQDIQAHVSQLSTDHSFWGTLLSAFPSSIVDAMAQGNILQIVVFSVFLGLALAAAGEKGKPVLKGLDALSHVMFQFTNSVMAFAPLGVLAAIASTVGKNGLSVLLVYAKLITSTYLALIVFLSIVLLTVCWIVRVPFFKLLQAIKEPFLIAFTTASSEAALPKAMTVMTRFGVPKDIVGFVMPTGYSFNLDGSTLYLSLATLFVAQMAGIHLPLEKQVLIMLTLMLTSKGIAAVPRVSLVVLTGTLVAFGLPVEGVAVILGIDHFLDMGRTSVNLIGNCVATTVIARWEGVLNDQKMHGFDPTLKDDDIETTEAVLDESSESQSTTSSYSRPLTVL
jgi:proton glutamate symport protein